MRLVVLRRVLFVLSLLLLHLPASAQPTVGAAAVVVAARDEAATPQETISFRLLDVHPHRFYEPYFAGPLLGDTASVEMKRILAFRDLMGQYVHRMGTDDNFTLRVFDTRTGETREVHTMQAAKRRYEREGGGAWDADDWDANDRQRREVMRRLIAEHGRQIPRQYVGVHWGRGDQVREAREREAPILAYEVRLAQSLGLTLLATEIGTVETFNQDWMVSSAGARSRYQMMPDVLRRRGVERYSLRSRSGQSVPVIEEHHPLLTMEPAFITLRAYVNAVGHEIPGLSGYHSGPYNQFRIYRLFLERYPEKVATATVADAFVWALTDGYDAVSSGSSFKGYSRGYVPSLYGSLRALDEEPIDLSRTLRAERVEVKAGEELYLRHLVAALETVWGELPLRDEDQERPIYDVLRTLNPHVGLPESEDGSVPLRGDVRLVARVGTAPVRFFVPYGATEALAARGIDPFDRSRTLVFDETTFAAVAPEERTEWDAAYDALIAGEARFGFTLQARERLRQIRDQFAALAEERPTPYRRRQLAIAAEHVRWWESSYYETLAEAVARARRRAGVDAAEGS